MNIASLRRIPRAVAVSASAAILLAAGVASAPVASAHAEYTVCHEGCTYSSIQSAVNAARNGAVIRIAPGTYWESVSIQGKRVSLVGVGDKTIIDATNQDHGIVIGNPVSGMSTAGTRISHLVVQHARQEGILAMDTRSLSITDNVVRHNALSVEPSGDNPDFEALHLMSVSDSVIAGNSVVDNNDGGIYLTNEFGATTHNRVVRNTVERNAVDCGITLASHVSGNAGVSYNLIQDNVSEHNGAAGVIIATPVPGGVATGNRVINNTVRHNGLGGIDIHGHAGDENLSGNVIAHNRISGNAPDYGATFHPTGISIFGEGGAVINGVTITHNEISDEAFGIALHNAVDAKVEHNEISADVPVYRF